MTGIFVAPYKQQRKEVIMKLVLAVLTIRLLIQLVGGKKNDKNKTTTHSTNNKAQHPAEFELR
jgi:hypothetical protein